MVAADPVWYQDVRVLAQRWNQFFPTREQNSAERVNALVRLIMYMAIGVAASTGELGYLLMGVGAVLAVSLLYRSSSGAAAHVAGYNGAPGAPRSAAAEQECVRSTPTNPFANVLLTDLGAGERPPACKYEDMKDDVRTNFNKGLFRNVEDIYERENSQRQFYTMPVTTNIPDTRAFADFCYAPRTTCKENPAGCTGYDGGGFFVGARAAKSV